MYPTSINHNGGARRDAATPAQRASDPTQDPPRSPKTVGDTADERPERLRVLVVDDAPDVTEMIGIMLRHAGYDVTTALSAPEAFDAAQSTHFDAVVSDIGMPGMSGWELARAVRERDERVPLAVITGWGETVSATQKDEAGVDWLLSKPFSMAQIVEIGEEVIALREAADEMRNAECEVPVGA